MTQSFILPKAGDLILLKKTISGNEQFLSGDDIYDDIDLKGLPPSPVFFMPDTMLLLLKDAKIYNEKNQFFVLILNFMLGGKIYNSSVMIYDDNVMDIYEILNCSI